MNTKVVSPLMNYTPVVHKSDQTIEIREINP